MIWIKLQLHNWPLRPYTHDGDLTKTLLVTINIWPTQLDDERGLFIIHTHVIIIMPSKAGQKRDNTTKYISTVKQTVCQMSNTSTIMHRI